MVFLSNAPENRDFRVKWEVLIISMLHPSGFVKKAERGRWGLEKDGIVCGRGGGLRSETRRPGVGVIQTRKIDQSTGEGR